MDLPRTSCFVLFVIKYFTTTTSPTTMLTQQRLETTINKQIKIFELRFYSNCFTERDKTLVNACTTDISPCNLPRH